jgi:hypothetical protein
LYPNNDRLPIGTGGVRQTVKDEMPGVIAKMDGGFDLGITEPLPSTVIAKAGATVYTAPVISLI